MNTYKEIDMNMKTSNKKKFPTQKCAIYRNRIRGYFYMIGAQWLMPMVPMLVGTFFIFFFHFLSCFHLLVINKLPHKFMCCVCNDLVFLERREINTLTYKYKLMLLQSKSWAQHKSSFFACICLLITLH